MESNFWKMNFQELAPIRAPLPLLEMTGCGPDEPAHAGAGSRGGNPDEGWPAQVFCVGFHDESFSSLFFSIILLTTTTLTTIIFTITITVTVNWLINS